MSSGARTYPIRHHVRQPVREPMSQESTNLSLSQDGQKDIRSGVSGTPRTNEQQRANSIKRRRFDEHGDDVLVQSSDSGWTPHRGAHGPAV